MAQEPAPDATDNTGAAPASRWRAPVVYLRDYPEHAISQRGMPYFACPGCRGWLTPISDPSGEGTMFVCVYGCGQRYWVDKTDGARR
jgi:hypothetical protein